MQAFVSNLRIYPIKSLDPAEVPEVTVGVRSLLFDRQFAIVSSDGRVVNGKRTGRVNELKATYEMDNYLVHFSPRGTDTVSSFHLIEDQAGISAYLSVFFGFPVDLIRNTEGRLMDIPDESSITIVSEASLESLGKAMPSISPEEMRLRFRSNLEIGGVPPYWEEYLFDKPGTGVHFTVGEVSLIGISPRARCNVPPKDPFTGHTDKQFIRAMMVQRKQTLPSWSGLEQYGGYYQLAVNTFIPDTELGKKIHVGDKLQITGTVNIAG